MRVVLVPKLASRHLLHVVPWSAPHRYTGNIGAVRGQRRTRASQCGAPLASARIELHNLDRISVYICQAECGHMSLFTFGWCTSLD